MKILVTGSSSHLATVLLPLICELPAVVSVNGVDIKKGKFGHKKFSEKIIDIRRAKISANYDVVIHLAFVVLTSTLKSQRKNRELIYDINVNGSINIFKQAIDHKIHKIIHLSSAVVYGAWPDNPNYIAETQNRKVMAGFSYAEDKNAVEDWLDKNASNTQTKIVRLRPHVILGANSQPFLMSLIKQPFYPKLANPQPLTQCIWEGDVASAIIQSIYYDKSGIFNLAADPAMSFKEMIKATHKIAIPLPIKALVFLHRNLWKISGVGEEPGWLNGITYSLAVDSSQAKRELKWKPTYSTEACLEMC